MERFSIYRCKFFKVYRISSNTRRGAYLIFVILGAALKRGRRLFRNLTTLFSKWFYDITNLVELWILSSLTLLIGCNQIDLAINL